MAEAQRCPNCGREMPAQAPHGLCPACLLGAVLDSQDENQFLQREPMSTAVTGGEQVATREDASPAAGTTIPVVSEQSRQSTDSAPTADLAPTDGPADGDGSSIQALGFATSATTRFAASWAAAPWASSTRPARSVSIDPWR